MLLEKGFEFQRKLQEKLGKDLVYSAVLDGDNYILSISTHKSLDRKFSHDRPVQTCIFNVDDIKRKLDTVVSDVVALYEVVLVPLSEDEFDDFRDGIVDIK